MKKWEKKLSIFTITGMILTIVIGFSYAYWNRKFTQTGVNLHTFDCFEITFDETRPQITQVNAIPQVDEEGLENEAYTITINNTCNTIGIYNVYLNVLDESTLDASHVKVGYNGNVKIVGDQDISSSIVSGATDAYKIGVGVARPNVKSVVSVKSWMDYDTTAEQGQGKNFKFQITIEALAAKTLDTLATQISSENVIGNPNFTLLPTKAGLYQDYDDDGTSYYYRGNVKNNYVKFGTSVESTIKYIVGSGHQASVILFDKKSAETVCNRYWKVDYESLYESEQDCIDNIVVEKVYEKYDPILWRIVRVNGDGTIRLISDEVVGSSSISEVYDNYAVGYTYNNLQSCTISNPCDSSSGTASAINLFLEEWYTNNIINKGFDNLIATSGFCNDTSVVSGNEANGYTYGASSRLASGTPSLKCPDTTLTYGGYYKLKVGLISADEVNMSGASINYDNGDVNASYLFNNVGYYVWTISPDSTFGSGSDGSQFVIDGAYSYLSTDSYDNDDYVRPVINLVKDAMIISGDGSKGNPYVIG